MRSLKVNADRHRHLLKKTTSRLNGEKRAPRHQIREPSLAALPFTIILNCPHVRLHSLMGILYECAALPGVEDAQKANSSLQRIWGHSRHPCLNREGEPASHSPQSSTG